MSGILGKFTKQPADVLDYDFDYSDWLDDRVDTIATQTVTADTGITVGTVSNASGVVKAWISGGTDGQTYKVTCTMTSAGGRIKQAEISIRVKEV